MIYHPNALTLDQVQVGGGYSVLLIDPPWSYDQKVRVTLDDAQYHTQSIEWIKSLPVGRLAAKDCALFCWGTWPQLPAVLETIAAWGFEYKTVAFLWVKRNHKAGTLFWGNGSWTRANTEPCFLATRGHPKRVDKGVHQLLEDFVPEEVLDAVRPDGKHSAKPAVVREKILRLMGDVPAIELFARERDPAFGNCWGDDPALGGSDVILEVPATTKCSVCGEVQFESPGGITCANGHGGAPAMQLSLETRLAQATGPWPTLFEHPIWVRLRPFAHLLPREHHRLDFPNLPPELREEALAVEVPCVACGTPTKPLRARQKSERSRIAGTEVEHRLFYAATCSQEVNKGCVRTKKAQAHVDWLRAQIGPGLGVTP